MRECGGSLVAKVLVKYGVPRLFTLCGGHISPILAAAEDVGIGVVDVRHEATAVFAADATARLSGKVGVAVVTAGPGVTNTVTAVRNAKMAQSPVVLIGGGVPTLLKGRGALQDIDQKAVMRPHVKWVGSATRASGIEPLLEKAFRVARGGVPGPVFIEMPVDLLYPEEMVRGWYSAARSKGSGLKNLALGWYMKQHLDYLFSNAFSTRTWESFVMDTPRFTQKDIFKTADFLHKAEKPLIVLGSQALLGSRAIAQSDEATALQAALLKLGIPVYLSGMARGLLGLHSLHLRHKRTKALKEADLVILAGVPQDFRLGYGRTIPRRTPIISMNLGRHDMSLNRKPSLGVLGHPGGFLRRLSERVRPAGCWGDWHEHLMVRERARDAEIKDIARKETDQINSVDLCEQINSVLKEDSIIIGDGGDFVATASYIVRPRGPLSWLDPGPFGTLGAGGGFALGAKLCRPEAEVWLLYGDGSAGYSLSEFHTFRRHGAAVIAVVGNDGSWAQIAREQIDVFNTPVAVELGRVDYDRVAAGFGAHGITVTSSGDVPGSLMEAKRIADKGKPVLINAFIDAMDFRKGSVSM